jgi:catechol 2,3-dioxygenase-like lactoylglutathione lyase family enzyme
MRVIGLDVWLRRLRLGTLAYAVTSTIGEAMGVKIAKSAVDLGIVTSNGEAMLAFYRDVLGLMYVQQNPMPGGRPGVMHRMMCGESMIKLIVMPQLPAKAPPGGIRGASGYRYWTITVTNISEIVVACTAAGIKIERQETEIRPGVRIAIVEDPDGNLVEFLSMS